MKLETVLDDYYQDRVQNKIRLSTIEMEIKYIRKFHTNLEVDFEYSDEFPFRRITYKHVSNFFDNECLALSERTVYRKITIITNYFDFLARKGYILIDFMPKFRKRFKKLSWTPPAVKIDYEQLVKYKDAILLSEQINIMPKLIYIMMCYGIEMRDMLEITVDNILKREDYILLSFENIDHQLNRIIRITDTNEIAVINASIELANKRNIGYLISTKSHNVYGKYNPSNLPDMMKPISDVIGVPINSTKQAMYAYIYHLNKTENLSVDAISQILAKPVTSTAKVIKTTLERVEQHK